MKLFRRGLLDLTLSIVLPIGVIFSLLIAYLGSIYGYAVLLFLIGTINLFNSLEWLHYRPAFFRKVNRLRLLDTPKHLVYAAAFFLLFVALLVFVFKQGISTLFCLLFFGIYTLLNWLFNRFIKSIILLYTHILHLDAFNWAYWLKISHPPQQLIRSFWYFISSYKKVSPQQLVYVIDLLFQRKYYFSLIKLQEGAFGHLSITTLNPVVQIRLLESIDELNAIVREDLHIQKQLKNKQLKLPFYPKLSLIHLKTVLNLDFMIIWLEFATKSVLQRRILLDYFNFFNEELSKFVANPQDSHLNYTVLRAFKTEKLPTTSEQIMAVLLSSDDIELQETLQYAYSLLLIAHGIALNLE